jgi:hypothetical protein
MANTKITADNIAANAITASSITDGTITAAKLAANSVDSDQYVDGSIDTVHIADGAVTSAKLDTNISISGELTLGSHLLMGDNDNIKLGTGADLQIYHDGTYSSVQHALGSGALLLRGGAVNITNSVADETMASFASGGAVTLYYAGATKLATTSTGIDVTGTATMDGLTVEGSDNSIVSRFKATNGIFRILPFETGLGVKVTALNGDESAFETLALQAEDFHFVTGTTERMRIAGNNLHLNGGTDARIQLGTGGAGANQVSNNTVHIRGDGVDMKLMAASGGSYLFEQNGTERMTITADGVVSAPIASTHGGQLHGAHTPNPEASYLGSNGADFGTIAIYRTPVITSSASTAATSQFLSIYSSGHWSQYPIFRFKVYGTYYVAGYREYVGYVTASNADLVEVQLNGTTSFIGGGGNNTITMSSAVSSGLAADNGQARYRRDFTLTSHGAYGRCYVVVEIMYGGNKYYGSNTTTADLDADGDSGGSYHFKTMSLAQGQGTFSST